AAREEEGIRERGVERPLGKDLPESRVQTRSIGGGGELVLHRRRRRPALLAQPRLGGLRAFGRPQGAPCAEPEGGSLLRRQFLSEQLVQLERLRGGSGPRQRGSEL